MTIYRSAAAALRADNGISTPNHYMKEDITGTYWTEPDKQQRDYIAATTIAAVGEIMKGNRKAWR